jgi:hypothetical protein
MQILTQVCDDIVECALLNNKLILIYGSEDFKGKYFLRNTTVVSSNSMVSTFQQTYKLMNLVSIIPATTTPAERRFSDLKRMKVGKHSAIWFCYQ